MTRRQTASNFCAVQLPPFAGVQPRALQSYGLAGGQPRTSHVAARHINFGDVGRRYVENMKWFIDQRNYSERDAAEEVAAFYFVDGKTFTTVVNSLRARFSEWKKSGFQIEETNDSGDIGYNVRVRPVNGRIVYMPGRPDPVPDSGVTVVFTNYWRRMFQDGDIEVSRPVGGHPTGGKLP